MRKTRFEEARLSITLRVLYAANELRGSAKVS